jgi:hypothetical protein
MNLKKKNPEPEPEPKQTSNENNRTFKKFGYWLAWINFLAIIGMAVYNAIKDQKPPEKDDFYK